MKENTIEIRFRKEIEKLGGWCPKWVSPGNDGVPDRIAVLPGGRVIFVELKGDGGELSPVQLLQIRRLLLLGQEVWVIDSIELIKQFLDGVQAA